MARRHSNEPFPVALTELLEEQDISLRELSRRTMSQEDWGRPSSLSLLMNGVMPPTFEAMERIARALSVHPRYFADYRLAETRRKLDPRYTPLENALALDEGVRRLAAYRR